MKEIKFLKDLPIKLTNTNKRLLNIIGGDIYYDSNGNRFGFITFNNISRSPIFCLQLFIREYSIEGKFIRDNEYFEPYTYYPSGNFVIGEPILLDKETEAIEVTIVKVTFNNRNLINDRFVAFKAEDYADLYQKKAPIKKPGTAASFSFNQAPSYSYAPAEQNKAEPEFDENGAPIENENGQQEGAQGVKSAINIERETLPTEVKQFGKTQKDFLRFIYPLVGLVALVIIFIIIYFSTWNTVAEFDNYWVSL